MLNIPNNFKVDILSLKATKIILSKMGCINKQIARMQCSFINRQIISNRCTCIIRVDTLVVHFIGIYILFVFIFFWYQFYFNPHCNMLVCNISYAKSNFRHGSNIV